MQSNSDGLSPGLKPFLGVGHNRALPAPFGFDNGFQGVGTGTYFTIPNMIGKSFPDEICFEWWFKVASYSSQRFVYFNNTVNDKSISIDGYNGAIQTTNYGFSGNNSILDGNTYLINVNYGPIIQTYINGLLRSTDNNNNFNSGLTFNQIRILNIPSKFDEFKIYNRKLSSSEIILNYNDGNGNNPCVTEHLLLWYRFEKFELLDFSPLQDGSDIHLGIRDFSGKNNHALPFNMDTDPASPTYVLKPF